MARLLLGLDPGLDAFASQNELAAALGVTRGRVAQQVGALQDGWADHPACRDLLDTIAGTARRALADVGGVATVDELAGAVLAEMPPPDSADGASAARIGAGLLRLALDRAQALSRADAGDGQISTRRRDGRIVLLAADPALLDPAEALGRTADELVAQAGAAGDPLVPAGRGAQRLRDGWARAGAGEPAPAGLGDGRLLRLAAALARDAVLSGSNELYHRDLSVTDALALALKGAGGTQAVTAHEIRDRVRARFPALPPLPDRPRLDQLISDAGLGLVYDDAEHGYRWPTRAADTKGLASRQATITASAGPQLVNGGRSGHRLTESAATRSFLALGVDADRTDRAVQVLTERFGAAVVDVTGVLISTMRAQAAEVGLPWDLVQAADAAPAGSRDAAGLAALVQRSLPAVDRSDRRGGFRRTRRDRPVVLTEIAPLARYGHLAMLSQWTDLAARRPQAIWVSSRSYQAARAPSSTSAPYRSRPPGSSSASTPSGSIPVPPSPPPEEHHDRHPRPHRRPATAGPAPGRRPARQGRGRPRAGGLAGSGAPAGPGQGAHGGVLGRLARRPGHPGGGRVGADHRVHPVLRGQRAGRAGLDRRA